VDPHIWPLLGIVIIVGIPAAVSTLFFPSIRAAFVRRLGGRAEEDDAALAALERRMDTLERQFDVLTQALRLPGAPGSFPAQGSPPPDRSLMR